MRKNTIAFTTKGKKWSLAAVLMKEMTASLTRDFSSFSDSCASSDAGSGYEIWLQNLDSLRERREKFVKLMGLDSRGRDCNAAVSDGEALDGITVDVDGMVE